MQVINNVLVNKLQEIVDLQAEIKLQEDKYTTLLNANEPLSTLKEIRLKIKRLKVQLEAKEEYAITLFY
jgi:hypothetical protein